MDRKQQIVRTGYVGVGANVLIAGVKAAIGAISGSMAIILDAVNNMTDALSSILAILGAKLAGKPANDKHPFGYGRIEYFAAVIIAVLIIVAGISSLVESVRGIFNPSDQNFTFAGLAIIAISIVAKFFLGAFTKRKGKELDSDSLVASGTECMMDCVISLATLVSAAVTLIWGLSLDCYLAAIISCLIIKVGIEMLMSPINELLGHRSDIAMVNAMKARVKTIDGVLGAYDVVLHDYGPEQKMGALHIEVDETMSAAQMHHLTRKVQKLVRNEFGIFVTVGFYAHNTPGSPVAAEEARIREHVMSMEGVTGMHGFYSDSQEKILSFDIVYSFEVGKPLSLRDEITEWLKPQYSDYEILVGLDRNYSSGLS